MVTTDELLSRLQVSIDKYFEWLVVYPEGRSFPLQANEIEIKDTGGRVVIGVPGEKGFRSWRVLQVDVEGEEVFIDVAGAFGSERSSIRLILRTPAAELAKISSSRDRFERMRSLHWCLQGFQGFALFVSRLMKAMGESQLIPSKMKTRGNLRRSPT